MSPNAEGRPFTLHGSPSWMRKRTLSLPCNDQFRRRAPGGKAENHFRSRVQCEGSAAAEAGVVPGFWARSACDKPLPPLPPHVSQPGLRVRHPASRLRPAASPSRSPCFTERNLRQKLPGRLALDQPCPGRSSPGSSQRSRPQPWRRAAEATGNWMISLCAGLPVHFHTHATLIEAAPRFAFKSS